MPSFISAYDRALTLIYNSSREAQKKIKIVPIEHYATFPIKGKGEAYDMSNLLLSPIMPQNVIQWEKGDWALGVSNGLESKYTYDILKEYEQYIIKE